MDAPALSLRRALARLREQGLAWIGRRVAHELAAPTTGPGKALFRARLDLLGLIRALRGGAPQQAAMETEFVTAFYDLAAAPVTYDVVWFIAGAELARRAAGKAGVHFVVVPAETDGLREETADYEQVVDREARRSRLVNLTLPAFSLLPAMRGITLATSRRHAQHIRDRADVVHPPAYEPSLPHFPEPQIVLRQAAAGQSCQVLESSTDARRIIARWLDRVAQGRRVVTITLRDYAFGSARNSSVATWAAFAHSLDPAVWCVVILYDTGRTVDPLPDEMAGFPYLHEASWNLPLRLALYEAAWLNLGINSGPMVMLAFTRARSITYRMVTEDVEQSSTAYMRRLGFIPGETPPVAHRFCKWVWEPDTPEVIRREFDAMVAAIEAAPPDFTR